MEKIYVMLELSHSKKIESVFSATANIAEAPLDKTVIPKLTNIKIDESFGGAQVPKVFTVPTTGTESVSNNRFDTSADVAFSFEPQDSTYIIRGEVADEKQLAALEKEVAQNKSVKAIYADVVIEPQLVCPGSGAVGTYNDVARLLCVSQMKAKGMDGSGVKVAIVDTGINKDHLIARGLSPTFDAANSWYPAAGAPFQAAVDHGTMCAFDVCIAAPKCTLLDIALLKSTGGGFAGLLSDAVRAYSHLLTLLTKPGRPGENKSLIISNSWGMFHSSWDYPVGTPGNYSNNPNHPFNLIVASLERAGADILFAAGNCGPECPDGRCQGITNAGIFGANSSPAVLSVAGIATNLDRVGYSNSGPGRLTQKKPDITGYTHFNGSGVYSADGGTSAACPVVAGVVAAIRTVRPLSSASNTRPAAIRNLVTSSAKDIGMSGFDFLYGFGLVDGCNIIDKLFPPPLILERFPFCKRFPKICGARIEFPRFINLCDKYPDICRRINIRDLERLLDRLPQFPPGIGTEIATISEMVTEAAVSFKEEDLHFLEGFLTALPEFASGKEPFGNVTIGTTAHHDCKCHEK